MNKTFFTYLLDAVLPPFCLACGKEGELLCPACAQKLIPVRQPTCFFCDRLTSHFESCEGCRSRSYLTGVIPSFYYEGLAKELVVQFKYHDFASLADFMARRMTESLMLFPPLVRRFDYLAFVPLHFWRQAFRGYNQAFLLAKRIAWLLHLPLLRGLRKKRGTKPQAQLTLKERRENLVGAFSYEGPPLLQTKILLVDDVATSGETLNQVAKVLRRAGAREVWGITFAKG